MLCNVSPFFSKCCGTSRTLSSPLCPAFRKRRKHQLDHDNWKDSRECHSNLKIKSQGKSIIQFCGTEERAYELGASEISMSELLRSSWDDGHVNLPVPGGLSCPLINHLYIQSVNVTIYICKHIYCFSCLVSNIVSCDASMSDVWASRETTENQSAHGVLLNSSFQSQWNLPARTSASMRRFLGNLLSQRDWAALFHFIFRFY